MTIWGKDSECTESLTLVVDQMSRAKEWLEVLETGYRKAILPISEYCRAEF